MCELWIPKMCERLTEVEQETHEALGTEATFFIDIYNDCLTLHAAVIDAYPTGREQSPVFLILNGLFKEIHWLHTLFVGGNYPYLNARLRFVLEATYRVTLAELNGPRDFSGRINWLREQEAKSKTRPGWDNCIAPLIGKLYPWASDVERGHYVEDRKQLWNELNLYVHPSVDLLATMCDSECPLLTGDHFHETAARQSITNGQFVFDLICLAVVGVFPAAIPVLKGGAFLAAYPTFDALMAKHGLATDISGRLHPSSP